MFVATCILYQKLGESENLKVKLNYKFRDNLMYLSRNEYKVN